MSKFATRCCRMGACALVFSLNYTRNERRLNASVFGNGVNLRMKFQHQNAFYTLISFRRTAPDNSARKISNFALPDKHLLHMTHSRCHRGGWTKGRLSKFCITFSAESECFSCQLDLLRESLFLFFHFFSVLFAPDFVCFCFSLRLTLSSLHFIMLWFIWIWVTLTTTFPSLSFVRCVVFSHRHRSLLLCSLPSCITWCEMCELFP